MKYIILLFSFLFSLIVCAQDKNLPMPEFKWKANFYTQEIEVPGKRTVIYQKCIADADSLVNNAISSFENTFIGPDSLGPIKYSRWIVDTVCTKVVLVNQKRKNRAAFENLIKEQYKVNDIKEINSGFKNYMYYYTYKNQKKYFVTIIKKGLFGKYVAEITAVNY
ncbi:MAG: hypothetical protein A2W91_08810 [Bacteroidetes bacterium GWF2_38_335]|nr:MAG: hypothetical protein A2W91_08810 [Bacteroidetes bacterium GWF2_38_335]OFY80474.1 MAG: hypothetical protein A2281_08535 [Bacteroidetes bacterium RIFOXYA12_FULL_38_20]HBS85918.1 hypothetical protein [Bacteroidales bacterium]